MKKKIFLKREGGDRMLKKFSFLAFKETKANLPWSEYELSTTTIRVLTTAAQYG